MKNYQAVRHPPKDFVTRLVSLAQLLAATNEEHLIYMKQEFLEQK
jgi:hypothetical protein